jgi:hypothetical protein
MTGVFPEYRKRGLGRWLKAAMLDKMIGTPTGQVRAHRQRRYQRRHAQDQQQVVPTLHGEYPMASGVERNDT